MSHAHGSDAVAACVLGKTTYVVEVLVENLPAVDDRASRGSVAMAREERRDSVATVPLEAIRAHARWIMVAFGLVCLVFLWRISRGPAWSGGAEGPGVPVELAAGQESALEAIVGRGVTLPVCIYVGADTSPRRVIGHYRCPGHAGPVSLELVTGPDERPLTDTTQRFGVIAGEGVPSALRAVVVARLRARENQLQWQSRGGHTLKRTPPPGATFSWRVLLARDPSLWLVLAVVVLCAVIARVVRD